jgi:hypothetical protein
VNNARGAEYHIATCLLKDRIFEREDMAVAIRGKEYTKATLEKLLKAEFSMPSLPRLYKEASWEMRHVIRWRRRKENLVPGGGGGFNRTKLFRGDLAFQVG